MIEGCDEKQFGILAELARVGFVHTNAFQEDGGSYLRVTRIPMGGSKQVVRYRIEYVTPRTTLWAGELPRSKELVRWWKSPGLISACEAAIRKHARFSLDTDQAFAMTGTGALVPESQELLKALS